MKEDLLQQTAFLTPAKGGDWAWATKPLLELPAGIRVLIVLSRCGVQKVFVPLTPQTTALKTCIEQYQDKKDLPEIFWWNGPGDLDFAGNHPILIVRGGFLFTSELLEWFRESMAEFSATKAFMEEYEELPLLMSVTPAVTASMLERRKGPEEFFSQIEASPVCIPRRIFCRSVDELAKPGEGKGLLAMVGKPTDRPHVVWVRHWTFPALKWTAHRGITPNQVTWAGFGVAIIGCLLIAQGSYWSGLLGALLLYASWVLDCMDGTLARLTFSESAYGRKLDTTLGHFMNVFIFGALVWAVWGKESWWKTGIYGGLILGGIFLAYRFSEEEKKHRTVSSGQSSHVKLRRFLDKINHRDYAVVIFILALLDGFKVFLWLSLIGIQVFWLLHLWLIHNQRHKETTTPHLL